MPSLHHTRGHLPESPSPVFHPKAVVLRFLILSSSIAIPTKDKSKSPADNSRTDGVLALCVLVLSVLIPSQGSPIKQRVGTYLWLGMLIVLFSLLIRMFRVKNGGYPFTIL